MKIKSFFVSESSNSIIEHEFLCECDCRDVSVLESWVPVFAEQDFGVDFVDCIGGHVFFNDDSTTPDISVCSINSVDHANSFYERDVSEFRTNSGVSLGSIIDMCSGSIDNASTQGA